MKTSWCLLKLSLLFFILWACPRAAHAYYDPGIQRWISRDPIGEKGGLNLYGMLSNEPVNKLDKAGHGPYNRKTNADAVASGDCNKDPQKYPWDVQKEHFPNDGDPYGGAYRHCVAACINAKCLGALGCLLNRIWDWANENDGAADSPSDMAGERVGEDLASSMRRMPCSQACLTEYPAYDGVRH